MADGHRVRLTPGRKQNRSPAERAGARMSDPPANAAAGEGLAGLCSSDALSLAALHAALVEGRVGVPTCDLLHRVCHNEKVSLDIVQFLLRHFPEMAAKTSSFLLSDDDRRRNGPGRAAYALHYACANCRCSSGVIRLLVQHCPAALCHVAMVYPREDEYCARRKMTRVMTKRDGKWHDIGGTPLHYYLLRSSSLELDLVKLLVAVDDRSLILTDRLFHVDEESENQGSSFTVLHCLLSRRDISSIPVPSIVDFLLETDPDLNLRVDIRKMIPLHVVLDYWDSAVHPLALSPPGELTQEFEFRSSLVRKLLNMSPQSVQAKDELDMLPIHHLCRNYKLDKGNSLRMLDMWPSSVTAKDKCGMLPIHHLCRNPIMDEESSLGILRALIGKDEVIGWQKDNKGCLPIRYAVEHKSAQFCKILIEAFPNSERLAYSGELLLKFAIERGNLTLVTYLIEKYPQSLQMSDSLGHYPIHQAARCEMNGDDALKILKLVLTGDPSGATRVTPKHCAMPGKLPLHLACGTNETTNFDIVKLLVEIYPDAVSIKDREGNLPLHYLCGRGNLEDSEWKSFSVLVDKFPSALVSKNKDDDLPIDFLGIEHETDQDITDTFRAFEMETAHQIAHQVELALTEVDVSQHMHPHYPFLDCNVDFETVSNANSYWSVFPEGVKEIFVACKKGGIHGKSKTKNDGLIKIISFLRRLIPCYEACNAKSWNFWRDTKSAYALAAHFLLASKSYEALFMVFYAAFAQECMAYGLCAVRSQLSDVKMLSQDDSEGGKIIKFLTGQSSIFSVFAHFNKAVYATIDCSSMAHMLRESLGAAFRDRLNSIPYDCQILHSFEADALKCHLIKLFFVSDIMRRHPVAMYLEATLDCLFSMAFSFQGTRRYVLENFPSPFVKFLGGDHYYMANSGQKTIGSLGLKYGDSFIVGYQKSYEKPVALSESHSKNHEPNLSKMKIRTNTLGSLSANNGDLNIVYQSFDRPAITTSSQDSSALLQLRMLHSKSFEPVLNELCPRLKKIRQGIEASSLQKEPPKKRVPNNGKENESGSHVNAEARLRDQCCGKAGKSIYPVLVGEESNLYKSFKRKRQKTATETLDLHGCDKETALRLLNDKLGAWVEAAMKGGHPYIIPVDIICGSGTQVLSLVVKKWIRENSQVANRPKQKGLTKRNREI